MAPKRLSPPPAASFSSSEEESEDVEEEEEEEEDDDRNDVVEEENKSEEEEERSSGKKSTVKSVAGPQPQSSLESDSESDFESNQTQRSPSVSDFTIRPIVSRTIKPGPNPGSKRPVETDQIEKESRKKKAKLSNGGEEDGVEETGKKGSGIQRLWSENDEIAILKGMIDFHSKKGADPYADSGAFLEFIKNSLHVDVSMNQLKDKIRRLKKKYQNNAEKGENGEDPVFSKPHESKSFELSKKFWGGGGGTNVVDDHVKNKRKSRISTNENTVLALPKQDVIAKQEASKQDVIAKQEAFKQDVIAKQEASNGDLKGEKQKEFLSLYPYINEAVESGPEPVKSLVKERLSSIGKSKAKDLEEKWRKLKVDEVKVYLKRVELIQEQTKLILDSMKPATS